MAQERKENVATEQEISYEAELKALKAKWAVRKQAEKQAKKAEEKAEKRVKAVEHCKEALEALSKVDKAFEKELSAVVLRLNMFIEGKRYTRNMDKGE